MIYILLAVLCMCGNLIAAGFSERRNLNRFVVVWANYAVAASGGLVLWLLEEGPQVLPAHFFLGPLTGFFYITALYALMACMLGPGVGVATAAMRLSVVFPIFISLVVFQERLAFLQGLGLAFAFGALFLIACKVRKNFLKKRKAGGWWLLGVFLSSGGVGASKTFAVNIDGLSLHFLLFLAFGTAWLFAGMGMLLSKSLKKDHWRKDIFYGAILGVANFCSNAFLLQALKVLPGSVAFAITNSAIIVFSTFFGMLAFAEKPGKIGFGIMLAATFAVIFLSLGA